jgi:hypothetical protein
MTRVTIFRARLTTTSSRASPLPPPLRPASPRMPRPHPLFRSGLLARARPPGLPCWALLVRRPGLSTAQLSCTARVPILLCRNTMAKSQTKKKSSSSVGKVHLVSIGLLSCFTECRISTTDGRNRHFSQWRQQLKATKEGRKEGPFQWRWREASGIRHGRPRLLRTLNS